METEVNKEKRVRPDGRGWVWDDHNKKWFRVRKLTPREAFRLMDVKESDIDKLMSKNEKGEQYISNSQLYKCAGNSIVVSCMFHMFTNLFYPEKAKQDDQGEQLTLF